MLTYPQKIASPNTLKGPFKGQLLVYSIMANPDYEQIGKSFFKYKSSEKIGIVPPGIVWLLLEECYRHPIDDSKIPPGVRIITNSCNWRTGPSDRPFCTWRNDGLSFRLTLGHDDIHEGIPLINSFPQMHVLPITLNSGFQTYASELMEPGAYLAGLPTLEMPSRIKLIPSKYPTGTPEWSEYWPCYPHYDKFVHVSYLSERRCQGYY